MRIIFCTILAVTLLVTTAQNVKADWRDAVGVGIGVGSAILEREQRIAKEEQEKAEREERERKWKEMERKQEEEWARQAAESKAREDEAKRKKAEVQKRRDNLNAAAKANPKMPESFDVVLDFAPTELLFFPHTQLTYTESVSVPIGTKTRFSLTCFDEDFGDEKEFATIKVRGTVIWDEEKEKTYINVKSIPSVLDKTAYELYLNTKKQTHAGMALGIGFELENCKATNAEYRLPKS